METRTTVKGILHDASGRPVSNAIVMIAQGSHSHHDIASVTNDSGEFYLSDIVVPGDYVLLIKTDSGSKQQPVSLSGNEQIQLQY
ncbi:carboxypeptidase-like regulatory domain-containing protein [Flavisolibacter nicotianae]|uniref:carboxypeptidase-like regulatory domain-containing protein n=1 Tax=Flavisolibacter nicotianae TaxID=2364882 RepID=UPI0013C41246|nr:carboxypeptidase-like regulatory domain-containing protein [Flavisolibacter nicotianae]